MKPDQIIHQTWKDSKIPEEYLPWVESVKNHHPEYEYKLWTDEDNRNLIKMQFPWFLETYDSYKHHIERVDAARYFILYQYGGIYIDLDMECLKPVTELFVDGELWFSMEAGPSITNRVISNAFMAVPKGHGFLRKVISNLAGIRKRDIVFDDVFHNTGPNMIHKMVGESVSQYSIKVIDLNFICPKGVIDQLPELQGYNLEQIRKYRSLYLIHHNTESWNIQLKCPDLNINGYTLFKHHDIPGNDINYIEYTEPSHLKILAACTEDNNAVGFNFNGYIKGRGGVLTSVPPNSFWLKKQMIAWVYLKNSYIDELKVLNG